MTSGEKRFSQRIEEKLDDDYVCWYDVPIGPKQRHPDFVILHPSRGFLILEVKDWKLETLHAIDKDRATLLTERGQTIVANPLVQARAYSLELLVALQRDPALMHPPGHAFAGKLIMPWGYGVVLANVTRANFDRHDLGDVLPPHLVICQDEMTESVDSERFQERLWGMFNAAFRCHLTLPQIDRFRWHVFPELRIPQEPGQFGLFAPEPQSPSAHVEIPDLIRVMDRYQEQLARSLGEGHRVIHGVAGSGKTMILGYRCQHLARALNKPILVLCYNKTLAGRLRQLVDAQGIGDRVTVRNFHGWCRDMLVAYGLPIPTGSGQALFDSMVDNVIKGVDSLAIPRAQYGAVLIDEGHDFQPEWFKLIVQMVDPTTNSLLVLYDDAQSIYRNSRRNLSFASVGIEARGRTTILKLNYRNTIEILATARAFAAGLLDARDTDEDGTPNVAPESAGRRGPLPDLVRCVSRREEAAMIVTRIRDALARGRSPNDIAILYRHWDMGSLLDDILRKERIPHRWANSKGKSKSGLFDGEPCVKLVTLHSSKGLEFPLVFIPGLCTLQNDPETVEDEAKLLYVGMTRALEDLVLSYSASTPIVARIDAALDLTRAQLLAG